MEIQHNLIIATAKKRGFQVTDLSDVQGKLTACIKSGTREELFIKGTPLSLINLRSLTYFDNKQLTKLAFSKLNIPHPKSILFKYPNEESVRAFFEPSKSYVCKPPDMAEGIGVEMNIRTLEAIESYWERNQNLGTTFMLEEQIEGHDLRAQVIDGKIIAACTREPAFVLGDGENNLNTLIEKRRKIMKSQNPMNALLIDNATQQLLQDQKLTLHSIPNKGQKVILKELANMSQGAVAIDVTENLHSRYQEWVHKIVDYLGVDYFAIDFITKSFTENPDKQAVVLEVNAQPEWLHHTFSENRQHDIASLVLDNLFG